MNEEKQTSIFEERHKDWVSGELFTKIFPELRIDPRFKELLIGVAEAVEPIARELARGLTCITNYIAPFAQGLALLAHQSRVLEDAGWLPHYTFPLALVYEFPNDPERLNQEVKNYYQSNWPEIISEMLNNINEYSIDTESQEVLREAIKLHELNCFRSVPRLLFPEIERVSRIDQHANKMSGIASVPELRKLVGEMSSSDVTFNGDCFEFFGRLVEHLYTNVDEGNLGQFQKDPIPNRHAALHGLVIYNSYQSSLNMLFMADFVFRVISVLRKNTDGQIGGARL